MKIGEAASITGLTAGNIRFYEKEHLISPQKSDANGYRDYSEAEVEQLKRIKLLRMIGVPVKEIRECDLDHCDSRTAFMGTYLGETLLCLRR